MKQIHLITGKDSLRPTQHYFQVKNGFVYATDSFRAVKIEASEVFGSDVISPNDELYFSAELWQLFKFHSARIITREGNVFSNDKGLKIEALDAGAFTQNIGRFPDIEVILPTDEKELKPVEGIGFNPKLLFNTCTALQKDGLYKFFFYGRDRTILIRANDVNGIGVLMPISAEFTYKPFEGIFNKVN